jgi:hypothetical protein
MIFAQVPTNQGRRGEGKSLRDDILEKRQGQLEGKLTAAITHAGGWKSTRMPLQYAEKINSARSGMARAAEKSGRDSQQQEANSVDIMTSEIEHHAGA